MKSERVFIIPLADINILPDELRGKSVVRNFYRCDVKERGQCPAGVAALAPRCDECTYAANTVSKVSSVLELDPSAAQVETIAIVGALQFVWIREGYQIAMSFIGSGTEVLEISKHPLK